MQLLHEDELLQLVGLRLRLRRRRERVRLAGGRHQVVAVDAGQQQVAALDLVQRLAMRGQLVVAERIGLVLMVTRIAVDALRRQIGAVHLGNALDLDEAAVGR